MTDKRFKETISTGIVTDTITGKEYNCEMRIDDKLLELLNELHEENQSKDKIIKGQDLEIVRLHSLADAMSGVLRELGIYDVYDKKQIMKVKEQLK